jgi:Protein of unknown function (DUF3352)
MSTPSTPATARRRGLARWTVAAAATAALVISGSGLVAFAQSGGGASQGPRFAPPSTIAYVEARLDLPAGQEDALAQMMTAFPGFADAGAFGMKKDEVLAMLADQLGATGIDGDLVGDVLTGEVGIALGGLDAMLMGGDPSLVVGLAVADAAAAGSVLDGLMAGSTEPPVETTYNDVTIRTDASSEPPASIALTDDWVLMGTSLDLVEQSIDALAGTAPSLADDEAFQQAWSRLPDARIGGAWMDFSSLGSLLDMATGMAAGQTGMAMPELDLAAILPQDMTAALVAEPDRLSLDVALTSGEMTPDLPVGESDLALSFPADTQVYVEAREVGPAIESGLTGLIDTLQAQAAAGDPSLDTSGVSDIVAALGPDGPLTALL